KHCQDSSVLTQLPGVDINEVYTFNAKMLADFLRPELQCVLIRVRFDEHIVTVPLTAKLQRLPDCVSRRESSLHNLPRHWLPINDLEITQRDCVRIRLVSCRVNDNKVSPMNLIILIR